MLNISLLALTLCAGTLAGPFRIAEAEPNHHQVCVRAAMAPDGHFAVAWVDSLEFPEFWLYELDLYIRFFDSTGNPMTEPYQIAKMADTNLIYWPCLEMDTAGNVLLVYEEEDRSIIVPDNNYIRFQRFAPDGSPVGSAQTLVPQVDLHDARPIGSSLANNDEFAVTWCAPSTLGGYGAWVQRFNREGYPKDNVFLPHDDFGASVLFFWPQVALSDAGDLVVTWYEFHIPPTGEDYPRFQVFDAADEPILGWEPMGHRLDDGEESYSGTRAETFWLDNDRFVVFWIDKTGRAGILPHAVGRVFSDRGLTRHTLCSLVHDSLTGTWSDPEGQFAIALSSDERFAETHTRSHYHPDDIHHSWQHQAGALGKIVDNEPWRRTTLFEYTPPWGTDTIYAEIEGWPHIQFPAVGVCDSLIVWVYSRFNTDTIFEAYAMITDWDMGEGVAESPIHTASPIQLRASLNRLSYDVPGEAKLALYSADGRKVLEETIQGKGIWTPPSSPPSSHLPSGVYFARVECPSAKATAKLVILR
jgi:hypothetical protein